MNICADVVYFCVISRLSLLYQYPMFNMSVHSEFLNKFNVNWMCYFWNYTFTLVRMSSPNSNDFGNESTEYINTFWLHAKIHPHKTNALTEKQKEEKWEEEKKREKIIKRTSSSINHRREKHTNTQSYSSEKTCTHAEWLQSKRKKNNVVFFI